MWETIIASLLGSKNAQTGAQPSLGTRGWQGWLGGGPMTAGGMLQNPSMGGLQGWLQQMFGPQPGMMPQNQLGMIGGGQGITMGGLGNAGMSALGNADAVRAAGVDVLPPTSTPMLQAETQMQQDVAGSPQASPWLGMLANAASAPVQQTGMTGGQTRGVLPGFQPQLPVFRFNAQGLLTRGGL